MADLRHFRSDLISDIVIHTESYSNHSEHLFVCTFLAQMWLNNNYGRWSLKKFVTNSAVISKDLAWAWIVEILMLIIVFQSTFC